MSKPTISFERILRIFIASILHFTKAGPRSTELNMYNILVAEDSIVKQPHLQIMIILFQT